VLYRHIPVRAWGRCAWLLGTLACSGAAFAQPSVTDGQRLVDAIEALREQGLVVIYSSELVTDDMRVPASPADDAPLDQLRAILEPFGLTIEAGPRDSWLVVQQTSAASSDSTTPIQLPRFDVRPPTLEEIVVSASRYAISRDVGSSVSRLDGGQLESIPTIGEDAVRALHALPGLTSSGLSSTFNVRGGASDEAMIFLDGVQIFDPFHLKDFQNIFSSISPSIIDSMTVYTGAFPAQYGDRMSAVIDIDTVSPDSTSFEVGASLFTSSFLGGSTFANGRGSWLASVRRGNLDLLIDARNSDVGSPRYLDALAKVDYELGSAWSVHAGTLVIDDEISLRDSTIASASANYADAYVWTALRFSGERLDGSLTLSSARLSRDRTGVLDDPATSTGALLDDRSFDSDSLRTDWSFAFGDRHLLSWGGELRSGAATYRYASSIMTSVPIAVPAALVRVPGNLAADFEVNGRNDAAYVNFRSRLAARITTEIGVRHDAQSYLDDNQWSPRFNALIELNDRLRLRTSWGRYFQAQRLDELEVENDADTFFAAQESEHYVVGVEYLQRRGTLWRLEVYRKEIETVAPRTENLFSRVSLLPELLPDRVRLSADAAELTGFELSVEGEAGPWSWWGSLARALSYDTVGQSRFRRGWEEPWSLKAGAFRRGSVWDLTLTTTWHDGWPISTLELADGGLVASDYNETRFGEFGSVDLRVSRQLQVDHGALEFYAAVTNVFARNNPCCIEYTLERAPSGAVTAFAPSFEDWLSIVPNVGFVWRFTR
jgi:outer membrane receptor protein involved in Fe transport